MYEAYWILHAIYDTVEDYWYDFCLFFFLSECRKGWFLFEAGCVSQCPPKTYPTSDNNKIHNICAPCHYSCAGCSGPADYECTSCLEDSTPYRSGSITNCVLTSLTSDLRSTKWFYRMFILFVLNLIVLLSLGLCFCITWYTRKREEEKFIYSKVTAHPGNSAAKGELRPLPQDSCLSDSD